MRYTQVGSHLTCKYCTKLKMIANKNTLAYFSVDTMEQRTLKNVNSCSNTNICSNLETSVAA